MDSSGSTEPRIRTLVRPLYRSTCVSRQLQLRTGRYRWCKVLLQTCPAHSDQVEDTGVLLNSVIYTVSHTHTHTSLTALCPGLPGAGTREVKLIQILLKQKTVSGSGISWAIWKSAPRCRQITTPAPHHSVFLQAGCPSCRPTNSVKALSLYQY